MLTPLDIENKKFQKQMMNGYNVDEVDDFLDEITVDYEKLYKDNTELRAEIERSKSDLEKYKNIEQTLQNTLVMAQKTADDIKNNPNILWKLDNGEWGTWDQLITAIEALDGNIAENGSQPANYYAPGTLPTAFNSADTNLHTVEWKWVFDEHASNREDETQNNDDGDTYMGTHNAYLGGVQTNPGFVNLKITITATQID